MTRAQKFIRYFGCDLTESEAEAAILLAHKIAARDAIDLAESDEPYYEAIERIAAAR